MKMQYKHVGLEQERKQLLSWRKFHRCVWTLFDVQQQPGLIEKEYCFSLCTAPNICLTDRAQYISFCLKSCNDPLMFAILAVFIYAAWASVFNFILCTIYLLNGEKEHF